jgi:hypothetical protein
MFFLSPLTRPATVITTYVRENNGSAIPANSTTIYVQNQRDYPTLGVYGPENGRTQLWVTVPKVPATLLQDVYNSNDYAHTVLGNDIVMTFPHTDLVIQQPTPYDEWFNLAIYTVTPSASRSISEGMTAWPAASCGTYRGKVLLPSGKDRAFLYTAVMRVAAEGVAPLNATYILPRYTPLTQSRMVTDMPSGLRE